MKPLQSAASRVASNRAKQFARKIDAIRTTSKVEAPEPRIDITAPTAETDALTGEVTVSRKPLHACGVVKPLQGKSLGTIATPRSYTIWLRAGMPPHPIYNRDAWKATHYVNGIALPSSGKPVEPTAIRHKSDCVCSACTEYRTFQTRATAVLEPCENRSNRDLVGKHAAKSSREWFKDVLLADLKLSGVAAKLDPVPEPVAAAVSNPLRPPLRTA